MENSWSLDHATWDTKFIRILYDGEVDEVFMLVEEQGGGEGRAMMLVLMAMLIISIECL